MAEKTPLPLGSLLPEIGLIQSAELRGLTSEIWQELWRDSDYTSIDDLPVSVSIDYPQIKHCRAIALAALGAAAAFETIHQVQIDHDLLVAGALLMDAGKLVETRPGPTGCIERTELGQLLPHAAHVARLVLDHGGPLELAHIMMCHSPNAGKAPVTLECRLLDYLDQADISVFGWEIWKRRVVHYQA